MLGEFAVAAVIWVARLESVTGAQERAIDSSLASPQIGTQMTTLAVDRGRSTTSTRKKKKKKKENEASGGS